jgi:hypothetical protein
MTPDEHEEGCLCGCEPLGDHEITPDHDLPATHGGVQGDRKPRLPKRRSDKTAVGEGD